LIHWPFPNHHGPGVDVGSRDPHAVPFRHESYLRTWRQLESLVHRGLVRHIGTSNMTVSKLQPLLRDAEIAPFANELELHPHFQQPELLEYLVASRIQPIGYSPFGSPSRPERDRTPEDTVDMEDPVIVRIAQARGITPAAVCIKWSIGRGAIPIPFSVKPEQYLDSMRAAEADPLTAEEMAAIRTVDRNCRLIKGQVFLWSEADGWEDLWK
ncbi:aldo/keto reductase, partial [bacterium]